MFEETVNCRVERIVRFMGEPDLRYLQVLLEQPDGPAVLADAVEARLEHWAGRRGAWHRRLNPTQQHRRERLHLLLDDRRGLPTMRQAVAAVNQAFGWTLAEQPWVRQGRRVLASHCWSHLRPLAGEQIERMLGALAALAKDECSISG